MSADSLTIRRAYALYEQLRTSGFFGGSGRLYEFERAIWECFRQCDGGERLVGFVLANVLDRIARDQESGPVTAEGAVKLANALSQPINQCMDYLIGRSTGQSAEETAIKLLDAFASLRK